METITRVFEFDAAHRVMNEKVKCFNLHGHRFRAELTFSYCTMGKLGYAVDFKEIKRIAGTWIDEHLDHTCILNPLDTQIIDLCRSNGWKVYVMGLGEVGDINPSAENLASELLFNVRTLFFNERSFKLECVRLYETPNCWVSTDTPFYAGTQEVLSELLEWRKKMGEMNYDVREE